MENSGKCFICGAECEAQRKALERYWFYVCEKCGRFGKSDSAIGENELKLRQMMYYYLKHKHIYNGKNIFFTLNKIESDDARHCVQYETLINLYPKNFMERIDMILMNLSLEDQTKRLTEIPRHGLPSEVSEKIKILDACAVEFLLEQNDEDSLYSTINYLYEFGYLRKESIGNPLSVQGRLRVQELEAQYKVIPQGFIAMCFDKKMDKAFDVIQKVIKGHL